MFDTLPAFHSQKVSPGQMNTQNVRYMRFDRVNDLEILDDGSIIPRCVPANRTVFAV